MESQLDPEDPFLSAISAMNSDLLSKKIVYVVACHSAKSLGPYSAVQNKHAKCYIGYRDKITVGVDDGLVLGFRHSANAGLEILSRENGTCEAAWAAIRNQYDHWIEHWAKRNSMLNALALMNNLDALSEPLGDANASL